ncbi:MAG TPA: prepilin-type N-terminal cleavage/methylation domain-containing protein [Gemmatimonadaceae bacterium]|nr:prepilin-type N-terminal cleavage/methylation domain-containing protein [Gemmatimonadaceae bacterium]
MLKNRRGLTLIEVMIAMVLLGLVLTGLTTVIMQQQRFYGGTAEVLETRANVRQVADILPSELRAVSPADSDIYAMSATSIDYRASTGSSVVCTMNGPRTQLTIPPTTTASLNGTSAWLSPPLNGDSLLVYDQGPTQASADDSWTVHVLTADPAAGICLPFTANAAEAALGYTLNVTPALSLNVQVGASIRFFRRARFELFNGADGQGYLGYSDCIPSRLPACSAVQPVSGPYLPLGGAPEGLSLSYFTTANAVTADPTQVARIDVVVRSRTRGEVRIAGYPSGRYTDSLTFSIAARN